MLYLNKIYHIIYRMRDDYLMTCESLKEAKKYKHFVQNHCIIVCIFW